MSSITAQEVTPTFWSVTVAGGATFTLTRAQLLARILAQEAPNRVIKALIQLRLDLRAALGDNFDPARMRLRIVSDGTFNGVEHFARVEDVEADEVT